MKLEMKNYTKKIKNKVILDTINYTFEEGNIYILNGRNGSGKTMILRAISGLMNSSSGEIVLNNKVLQKNDFLPNTSILIGDTKMLDDYTGLDNLKILNAYSDNDSEEQLKGYLEKVGLDPNDKRKVKEYSLGMNQKLNLSQLLIGNKNIWLIDEPTNSLDKDSAKNFNDLLNEVKKDKIIIIASHIKEDFDGIDYEIKIKDGCIYE